MYDRNEIIFFLKQLRMITIKQFANESPDFDVQFRPFFED
jgi:hypothetical protein